MHLNTAIESFITQLFKRGWELYILQVPAIKEALTANPGYSFWKYHFPEVSACLELALAYPPQRSRE